LRGVPEWGESLQEIWWKPLSSEETGDEAARTIIRLGGKFFGTLILNMEGVAEQGRSGLKTIVWGRSILPSFLPPQSPVSGGI